MLVLLRDLDLEAESNIIDNKNDQFCGLQDRKSVV